MNKKTALVKGGVSLGSFASYFGLERLFYPVVSTDQALKQLDDTNTALANYELFQQLWNFGWILPVVLCLVIFAVDIKQFINNLRGGF